MAKDKESIEELVFYTKKNMCNQGSQKNCMKKYIQYLQEKSEEK